MLEIIKIIVGALIMISTFVYFIYIVLDLEEKLTFRFWFFLFINIFFHIILNIFFFGFLKTIFIFLCDALFCYKAFNVSIKRALYLTFCYMIFLIIPDLIQLFLITYVVGINKIICYNEIAGSVISNAMVCIFFIILTNILKKFLKKVINVEVSNNIKIIIFSLFTFFAVGLFFFTFAKEFKIDGNSFPYFVAMFILVIILFSLIKQTVENNKLMKEYDQLLEFMTSYEEEIEKQRILRHETKNEFLSIKAKLCDKQNNKEIVDYIDEILKDKIIVNNEKYAKFGYLPPNGIKGLCYFKVQEAENRNITVSLNISAKIKKSNINDLSIKEQRDLGKLLGIFLDNAIEASGTSNKKQLGIEAYISNDDEFIMIITNTFDEEINRSKIGKERFTTKGKDRGHGLLLAKHIIGNNNIFETKTEILNGVYVQSITIKKEKTNE